MPAARTLEHHILTAQRRFPDATGTLTALLYDLALAAKVIAREATRTHILERPDTSHEPRAARLARFAAGTLVHLMGRTNRVGIIGVETEEHPIRLVESDSRRYVLLLDPLDAVSPSDYTVSIGTIFGIYRPRERGVFTEADCLQPGRELVAAGYILYGSSTAMVYSSGHGVNEFTLDPGLGEFLLSHEDIQLPTPPRYYSLNHAHDDYWSAGMRRFARYLQGKDSAFPSGLSMRYTGSLVADFHRNLLSGGIFCYPADTIYPEGKMFLTYEANPLAFLVEQAGGVATDGHQPILDLRPTALHQRTPLFIGNRELVERLERLVRLYEDEVGDDYH
jgi:fructose-1,6-bisphosphatase I